MPVFQFTGGTLIDRVAVVKTEGGGARAYLHAREDAAPGDLDQIQKGLSAHGWQAVPTAYDGQPALEVRGFGKEGKLLDYLRVLGAAEGAAAVTPLKEDRITFVDRLRKSTLQLCGLFYFIGDIGYTVYGKERESWEDVVAGVFYFAGSATLTLFGQADQSEFQLNQVAKKMRRFLMNESPDLLPGSSAVAILSREHDDTLPEKLLNSLRHYPAEWMNTFFGLAGVMIAKGAFAHTARKNGRDISNGHNGDHKVNSLDVMLGVFTAGSGAISTLVEEQEADPTKAQSKGLNAVIDWVRQKPLRVAGYGYMVSTLIHAVSTYQDFTLNKRQQRTETDPTKRATIESELRAIPFRALFVGANLVAEFLMTISSKGHGDGITSDISVDQSSYAIAADLIARQPKKLQESLIAQMAGFLAHPDVLGGSAAEIQDGIRTQMANLIDNPWVTAQKPDVVEQAEQIAAKAWEQKPDVLAQAEQVAADAWRKKISKEMPQPIGAGI